MIKVSGGSATLNKDFVLGDGQTNLAPVYIQYYNDPNATASYGSLAIVTIDDGFPELEEIVELELTDQAPGFVFGARRQLALRISNRLSTVAAEDDYTIEGSTPEIIFRRSGDTNAAVEVSYFTADKTAKAGADYLPLRGTLRFEPCDRQKVLVLQTFDNTVVDEISRFLAFTWTSPLEQGGWDIPNIDNEMPANIDLGSTPPVNIGPLFAVQSDGKITCTRWSSSSRTWVRLNPDGSVDPTFHSPSYVSDSPLDMGVAPNLGIRRLRPDGTEDFDFGARVQPVFAGLDVSGYALLLTQTAEGKLLVYSGGRGDNFGRLLNVDGTLLEKLPPIRF